MACDFTNDFQGVDHYGLSSSSRLVEENLKFFLDNALLNIGAWTDVQKGQLDIRGGDVSALRQGECLPGYAAGELWHGQKKDWVYETVTYTDMVSGTFSPTVPIVYVGGNPLPSGDYLIDYPNGRVVLAQAETVGPVQAAFSYRAVQVYVGDNVPWWREIEFNSWDVNAEFFQNEGCGDWVIGTNHRVQMPTIVINLVANSDVQPLGLGQRCIQRNHTVKLHVLAETKRERDRLVDILSLQRHNCVNLFDYDEAFAADALPLDENGFLNPSGMDYDTLVTSFNAGVARIDEATVTALSTMHWGFYYGVVSLDLSLAWCGS